MPVVETDVRVTRESADRLRYEPGGPIIATNVQEAIEAIGNVVAPAAKVVTFAMSPYTPLAAETLLLVDTSGGAVTIAMPLSSTRQFDLEVKDSTGNSVANPISVNRTAPDTIDGLTTYTIDSAYGAARLGPKTGGYFVHA